MGHGCREKGHWSHWGLRVIPAAACGPSLALLMRAVEGNRGAGSREKWAASPHEMDQARGMDGASSSLKHMSTHNLSV